MFDIWWRGFNSSSNWTNLEIRHANDEPPGDMTDRPWQNIIALEWTSLESSHANDESPDDMWVEILRLPFIFINLKVTSLPTSQKPGSKWIKMFYFPFQIDKEGGGSLSLSLCHHQLAGDSQQDTMIGTWESFYLPSGVSALYDKTELASPKPHDPTHNRSFLSFPSLFQALDIHRLS